MLFLSSYLNLEAVPAGDRMLHRDGILDLHQSAPLAEIVEQLAGLDIHRQFAEERQRFIAEQFRIVFVTFRHFYATKFHIFQLIPLFTTIKNTTRTGGVLLYFVLLLCAQDTALTVTNPKQIPKLI